MLYKEELKKVPLCPIPELSKEELKGKVYIAGVKITEINRCGKTLVVDYYSIKSKELQARFFCNGETYCCYDAKEQKWRNKYISTILFPPKDSPYRLECASDEKWIKKADLYINKSKDDYLYLDCVGGHFHLARGILAVTDKFISERREEARKKANSIAETKFRERRLSCFKPNNEVDEFCNKTAFSENIFSFLLLIKTEKGYVIAVIATMSLSYKKPQNITILRFVLFAV